MSSLADYSLFSYAEWKDRDWKSAIKSSEGVQKRLLQMQEMAVHAVAGLEPSPVTPEKLAWSVLWTRGFLLLQAAQDLYDARSVRAAELLHRSAFELWLQVEAIRQPWGSLKQLQSGPSRVQVSKQRIADSWAEVRDQLRGFAAWALTNDLLYYRYRVADWELRRFYSATDSSTLPKTAQEAALRTYFWGEIEITSEAEARQDRERARMLHGQTVQRLLGWLTDPSFGHWSEDLAPWITGQEKEIPSFFAILHPPKRGPRQLLSELGAAHLYSVYSRGSLMIHGSSISHFVQIGADKEGGVIIPLVLASPEDGEQLCLQLANTCQSALLGLWGMRDHCLK